MDRKLGRVRAGGGGASLGVSEEAAGGFNIEAIWLAKRALGRARETQGEPRPEGLFPKQRRVLSLPEYGGNSRDEAFTRL